MPKIKHFIIWEITPDELEELANELHNCPTISISIDEDVELIIKRSKNLLPKLKKHLKLKRYKYTYATVWHCENDNCVFWKDDYTCSNPEIKLKNCPNFIQKRKEEKKNQREKVKIIIETRNKDDRKITL